MEIWKDVIGYEGLYQVSDYGNVKSLNYKRSRKEVLLKKSNNGRGYLIVLLCKNGLQKTRNVHQLVAETFLNHTPCGFKLVINHKNFIRTDNRVENLEIVTQRENSSQKHLKSSSKYIGVSFDFNNKKWHSSIWIDGKKKHLGCFNNEIEASQYYEKALKAHLKGEKIITKKPIFSSEYKGVHWDKNAKKWRVKIRIDNKPKHIGLFETEIEAHNAYQKKLYEQLTKNKL